MFPNDNLNENGDSPTQPEAPQLNSPNPDSSELSPTNLTSSDPVDAPSSLPSSEIGLTSQTINVIDETPVVEELHPETPSSETVQPTVFNPSQESTPTPAPAPLVSSVPEPNPNFVPPATNDQTIFGVNSGSALPNPVLGVPAGSSKKKLLLVGIISFILVAGVLAYIFGVFIPSKPENVYATAMDRSGKGMEKVITQVTTKSELDKFKKGEYNAQLNANFEPVKVDGKANLKYDNSKLDLNVEAKVTQDGQTEQNYKARVLTEIKEGSTYPDIYFIINGLSELGLEGYLPGIESIDSTWIKIEESYIKDTVEQYQSLLSSGGDTDITKDPPELTSEDIEELGKVASSVIRDYVFTKDTTKSILFNKNFLGKEKIDGLNTYHYVVGVNKDNYVTACIEAANRLFDSTAYKKLSESNEEDIKSIKEESKKSCEDSKSSIKDDEVFDVWVDAKYKLIYKILDFDDNNPEAYIEIGQKYKGGDDMHFFVKYEDKKAKVIVDSSVDMNIKTLVSKGKLTIKSDDEAFKGNLELSVDGKPLEGDITIEKPSNPKTLQQVVEELGLGSGEEVLDPLGVDVQDDFYLEPGI